MKFPEILKLWSYKHLEQSINGDSVDNIHRVMKVSEIFKLWSYKHLEHIINGDCVDNICRVITLSEIVKLWSSEHLEHKSPFLKYLNCHPRNIYSTVSMVILLTTSVE